MKLYMLEPTDSDAPLGKLDDIMRADVVLRPEDGGYRVVKNRWGKAGWHAEKIEDAFPPKTPEQLAAIQFEFKVTACEKHSGRFRRTVPDQPMPSREADEALHACADEIKRLLEERGFVVARCGYGVSGLTLVPAMIAD